VLDDDREMGAWLVDLLTDAGYTTEAYQQGPDTLAALEQCHPDLLITDLVLDGMKGMEVLRRAKQREPSLAVVMVTAFGTIESTVEAMRLGAFYYLTKPFKSADLLLLVERALEEKHLRTEIRRLQQEVETHYHFDRIIGKSPAMQQVFALVERLKDRTVNVLLTGESGTYRQGPHRALPPLPQQPQAGAVCTGQLCCHSRAAVGERAVWVPARSIH
jgi:DNA-binding NtrC family response regulator